MSQNTSELGNGPLQLPDAHLDPSELAALARRLQDECDRLKQALAKTEAERDLYRKAAIEQARATLHFEDVTIPDLEKISAGPVEFE